MSSDLCRSTHRGRKCAGTLTTPRFGTPVNQRNLFRAFKALLAKAGRTSGFPTSGIQPRACPMRAVMELLGHSSISTTADILRPRHASHDARGQP
jgi:integrase